MHGLRPSGTLGILFYRREAMQVLPQLKQAETELVALRRDIHAHPELAFEEHRTADLVANRLAGWGIDVHRGLGKTGVVGTLKRGTSSRAIGLRADMDALPIQETNTFDYRSTEPGKMHACGHDGHTAMLLGAAQYLAEHGDFDGTVQFIFQPAEEGAGGARVMVEEGLFEQFPVDAVYGMHNWPGLGVGKFAVRTGPMMASVDMIDIEVRGAGGHGALPHLAKDPVIAAAHVVTAMQSVVARNVDPLDSSVVSITTIHGGDAHNVIPASVKLTGALRSLSVESRDHVADRIIAVARETSAALGCTALADVTPNYPVLINTPEETAFAARVAAELVGSENVDDSANPVMGSEDFAFMLQARPGCYLFIGNGDGVGGCTIHNPGYDFNDQILTLGSSYWVRMAETHLRVA